MKDLQPGNSNDFIIPAIDIIDGKAVRLTHGNYAEKKVYHHQPVDLAKSFEDADIRRLHLVDLDAAKAGTIINWKLLEKITAATNLQVDFGGGVKQKSDVITLLNAGAAMVTIGSVAVQAPEVLEEWIAEFGADKFFIGADVFEERLKISGWLQDGGIGIHDFLNNMINIGAQHFFCTDIAKDGALQGSSIALYKRIVNSFPSIRLTASGGVASMQDVLDARSVGCKGIIVGKAIYEGFISLQEIQAFNSNNYPHAL